MSAERSARSVSQAEGLDPVRALQRVLYRSAKQDRTRRFHALYGHVARSDVMWRCYRRDYVMTAVGFSAEVIGDGFEFGDEFDDVMRSAENVRSLNARDPFPVSF